MSQNTSAPATSRDTFVASATPMQVKIGDRSYLAVPKTFYTGSLGWNVNDKMPVVIDGKAYMVQIGLNLTLIGSKEWE
jgi:hypothetical protein